MQPRPRPSPPAPYEPFRAEEAQRGLSSSVAADFLAIRLGSAVLLRYFANRTCVHGETRIGLVQTEELFLLTISSSLARLKRSIVDVACRRAPALDRCHCARKASSVPRPKPSASVCRPRRRRKRRSAAASEPARWSFVEVRPARARRIKRHLALTQGERVAGSLFRLSLRRSNSFTAAIDPSIPRSFLSAASLRSAQGHGDTRNARWRNSAAVPPGPRSPASAEPATERVEMMVLFGSCES